MPSILASLRSIEVISSLTLPHLIPAINAELVTDAAIVTKPIITWKIRNVLFDIGGPGHQNENGRRTFGWSRPRPLYAWYRNQEPSANNASPTNTSAFCGMK